MMISMSHQTAFLMGVFIFSQQIIAHIKGNMLLTCCCNLLENTNVQCKLQYDSNGSIVDSHPGMCLNQTTDGLLHRLPTTEAHCRVITNNVSLQHMANEWGSEMMISMSHQTALPNGCFHLLPTNHCTHQGKHAVDLLLQFCYKTQTYNANCNTTPMDCRFYHCIGSQQQKPTAE